MVNDGIATTRANIAEAGVASVAEVRAAGRTLGTFSPDLAAEERDLKRFMYASLYHHSSQVAPVDAAKQVVSRLFAAAVDAPQRMGEAFAGRRSAGRRVGTRGVRTRWSERSHYHSNTNK